MRGVRRSTARSRRGPPFSPPSGEEMSAEKISATTRTEFGKGAARRARRANTIPAVIYGHGNDPMHILLPTHATTMALRHGGAHALLDLDIEGTTQLTLTKAPHCAPNNTPIAHPQSLAVSNGEKQTI